MISLWGPPALTNYRQRQLLTKLRRVISSVRSVSAQSIYFVDSPHLGKDASQLLQAILPPVGQASHQGKLFLVVPRIGTISPWSSKATDIIHNCGLTQVRRVESGVAYFVQAESLTKPQQSGI